MKNLHLNYIRNSFGRLSMLMLMTVSTSTSFAQINWDLINTSSTSSGLPSDEVIALRFDNNGRLWTSTNLAFANYDGAQWYVYGEEDGITWGQTRMGRVYIDSENNAWICSDENGVVKVGENGDVTVYNTDNGLMSNLVFDVVEDGQGGYYISNWEQFGNTLSHIDKDGNWKHYAFSELGDNPFDNIFTMYYDKKSETLFVGTLFSGVKKMQNGVFSDISVDYQTAVSEITSDGNGIVYAATDIGLLTIDTEKDYEMKLMTIADGLPDNFTTSVAIDGKGNVWAGTDGFGVSKIKNDKIEIYSTDNGLTSNDIYTITFDNNDNAWLGTHLGGICHQDGNGGWKHIGSTGLAGNDVSDILFDGDVKWFATGSGISRLDGELWKNYTFMNEEGTGLASNRVTAVIKDNREGKNKIYASGYGGIAKYNSMFDEWEYYKFTSTDKEGNMKYPKFELFQMSDGSMWVTTFGENLGFASFDAEKGELTYYNDSNVDVIAPNCNSFFKAVEAPDGAIWFCSVDGAVILKDGEFSMEKFETKLEYEDPETGEIQYGYDNNVRTVSFDSNGNAWVGKISGIMIYDPVTGEKVQEFGNDDDPVTLVTDFWFDKDGNAMISTLLNGIYVRANDGTYYHLGKEYGLDKELMVYNMKVVDGKMYICCENGVMITEDYNMLIQQVIGNGETTGIRDINVKEVKDSAYYTLEGIKVNVPVKNNLYIHNGKKIIFK